MESSSGIIWQPRSYSTWPTRRVNQQYYYETVNMHSTHMANAKYSGNTSNMLGANSHVIAKCVKVGLAWHKHIGVEQSKPLKCSISDVGFIFTEENQVFSPPTSDALVQHIKAFCNESIAFINVSMTESMAEMTRLYFSKLHTALHCVSNIEVLPFEISNFQFFIKDLQCPMDLSKTDCFRQTPRTRKWKCVGNFGHWIWQDHYPDPMLQKKVYS